MSGLVVLKALLVAAVLFAFLATVGTLDYRVTETAVEVLILGCVARRIRLGDIEEVHRRGALLHEGWSGPRFWNSMTLRRKSGLLRNFVISPDEPDRFVENLREVLRRAGG